MQRGRSGGADDAVDLQARGATLKLPDRDLGLAAVDAVDRQLTREVTVVGLELTL
jgi:hypothetical protein